MRVAWIGIALLAAAGGLAQGSLAASHAHRDSAANDTPIDFDTRIIPVLTKAGCNAGACHGSAAGQGGFHLSLWGTDAAADYDAIVRQAEGRRVNLAHPSESLLIAKATSQIEHGGDQRFDDESESAQLLLRWIARGARRTHGRKLVDLDVQPKQIVLSRIGDQATIQVRATFQRPDAEPDADPDADPDVHEVAVWSVFTSQDAESASVDALGTVTAAARGTQTTVLVRFLDRIEAVTVIVRAARDPVDLSREPRANFIDEQILAMLEVMHLAPLEPASDQSFLRRACLDLAGRLPTPEERAEFLADDRADKRSLLVDRLLASEDYAVYWTLRWARLLRLDSSAMDAEGASALYDWLHAQVRDNTPWNHLVRELLVAQGDSHQVGAANFARATGSARDQAEQVGQAFLGIRLQCANCHDHPLDRWTQDDYHGLAAIFARLDRSRVVRWTERGEVTHPRTNEAAAPRLPGERFLPAESDQRGTLADWLASDQNPWFAQALVNRLWQALLGRGLVEPVDDLRPTNPATHPDLLRLLAEDFVAHHYDVQHTLRLIANSRAYARRSAAADPFAERFLARAATRALAPEVLLDAISSVTMIDESFPNLPAGTRAVQVADRRLESPTLDLLGRCTREGCGPSSARGVLARQLHLINGPLLNDRLENPQGRLAKLLHAQRSNEQIVEELYLRALCRLPSERERETWKQAMSHAASELDRQEMLVDFAWSLLTGREFSTNH